MNANSSNEISPEDKNYKINMNILSSLKPLQGKVVNLNSEDILPKKEDDNKSNFITIDNFSTANSIPKITKEILFNNISPNYIPLKNISKTTSVFKPIPQYLNFVNPTSNYYNFNLNNIISNLNLFLENKNINNPYLTINPFYSLNSFYPLNSQNLFLNNSKSNFHRFLNIFLYIIWSRKEFYIHSSHEM